MKGLILAGGKGTRLRPLTHTGAKQVIPIANKPIINYIAEDLVAAGITEIGVVVGYTQERIQSIKDALGDGSAIGAKITYIEQDAPRGIAHAVLCARDFVGNEKFVVYLGDNLLQHGIKKFVSQFSPSDADASILLTEVDNPQIYGVACLDSRGSITKIEEKPKNPASNKVVVGVYLFTSSIFSAIKKISPSARGELEITDAISRLLADKHKVISHVIGGWWDDTGTPEAILSVNQKMLEERLAEKIEGEIDPNARVSGRVAIGAGTRIGPGCFVIGPSIIGKGCTIANARIGPYASIGDGCTIENADIASSVLLGGNEVTTHEKIQDSIIGRNSRIISGKGLKKGSARIIIGENSTIVI